MREALRDEGENIRIIRLLWLGRLGDLLVSTPLIAGLRARFPGARLSLITGERGAAAAGLIADVDERLVLRRWTSPISNLFLAGRIASEEAGMLLDLNPAYSRASWALAALARSRVKLAFRKGRGDAIFTALVDPPGETEHMLSRYRRLADALGAPYEPRLRIRIPSGEDGRAAELLDSSGLGGKGLLVGVFPGNFKKRDNRWPKRKFAELMQGMLDQKDIRLFVLCGPGEEGPVRRLLAGLDRPVPALGPLPIGLTAALLKMTDLLVTNATGAAHLAVAAGTPTFSILSGYTRAVWMYPAPGLESEKTGIGPSHFSVVSPSWESCRDVPVSAARDELRRALDWVRSRRASSP